MFLVNSYVPAGEGNIVIPIKRHITIAVNIIFFISYIPPLLLTSL
jgi:hypothetical protein